MRNFLIILLLIVSRSFSAEASVVSRHSPTGQLEAREIYTGEAGGECLCRIERFFWEGPSSAPLLVAAALENEKKEVLCCRTFSYNGAGKIVKETVFGDLSGSSSHPLLQLNERGLPLDSAVEHYSKRYIYFDHDPSLLSSYSEDNGVLVRYAYHPGTRLLAARLSYDGDRLAIRQFYQYDSQGRLVAGIVDDGEGADLADLAGVSERQITSLQYGAEDSAGSKAVVIEQSCLDAAQQERLLKRMVNLYSSAGKLLEQAVYDGAGDYCYALKISYDEQDRPVASVDSEGEVRSLVYDEAGKLVFLQGSQSNSKEYDYDSAGVLFQIRMTDPQGLESVVQRHADDHSQKVVTTDVAGNETEYLYDDLGRLTAVTFPEMDVDSSRLSPRVEALYDSYSLPKTIIDAQGNQTAIRYNSRGAPVEILHSDGTKESRSYYLDGRLKQAVGKDGIAQTCVYDYLGRVIQQSFVGAGQQESFVTIYTYNSFHLLSETDATGNQVQYSYNDAGLLQERIQCFPEGMKRESFEYDARGFLYKTKQWSDSSPTSFIALITDRDAFNRVLNMRVEDSQGKILYSVGSDGTGDNRSLNNFGADKGRKLSGGEEEREIDPFGRLLKKVVKNDAGEVMVSEEFAYDLNGNKTRSTRSGLSGNGVYRSISTSLYYGSGSRLESVIEAEGSSSERGTSYRYDEAGRLTATIKPDCVTLFQEYDGLGRLARLYSSDHSVSYQYHYDASHQLVKIEDLINESSTLRELNSGGQVVSEQIANGLLISNTYDEGGRRLELILPDTSRLVYHYEGVLLTRIKRLSVSGQELYCHTYAAYDQLGRPKSSYLAGAAGSLSCSWDAQQRCTQIESPHWSQAIPSEAYDEAGNVLQWVVSDPSGSATSSCLYDSESRLISENGPFEREYKYDAFDHRIGSNDEEAEVNDLYQLVADQRYRYNYDINGNLISKANGEKRIAYFYDALDRLVEVRSEECFMCRYSYDPFGRRLSSQHSIWNKENGSWEGDANLRYLYDGDNDIGAVDAAGNIVELRVLGAGLGAEIGGAVAIELKGKAYAPIHDHRGSVVLLTDIKTGQPVEFYRYSGFGELAVFDGNGKQLSHSKLGNPWMFSSKRYEPETGLVYFGARYYDSKLGRWITRDPLGVFDSANPYAYVRNNPINHIDLYGRFACPVSFGSMISAGYKLMEELVVTAGHATRYMSRAFTDLDLHHSQFEDVAESILGKMTFFMTGYFPEDTHVEVHGKGEVCDKVRITHINGVMTPFDQGLDNADLISRSHGGVNVHFAYRASWGWTWDIAQVCMVKAGFPSPQAYMLAARWRDLINEMGGVDGGGRIIHYAHSVGGTDSQIALSFLTPEEQRMIHLLTFGSATLVPDGICGSSVNYVSRRDGVPFADPIAYIRALATGGTNVVFLGSIWGCPMIDHPFRADTYKVVVEALGEEFVRTYGSMDQPSQEAH